ncbi:MAG: amidohydrolase [Aureliella sp.]
MLLAVVITQAIVDTTLSQEAKYADMAIVGGKVVRCNADMDQTDAIAVRDGRIVALGSDAVRKLISADKTTIIDAAGQFVTPGLTDSHLHFIGLGQSLQMLDLSGASSWSDIVEQVRVAAASTPKGTWIEGRGWHQSKWEQTPPGNVDGYPSHSLLSRLVPDHPVLLTHASGHACFANGAAMKLAGVTAETASPRGGEILRDELGQPIGVFRENAQSLVRGAKARTEQKSAPGAQLAVLKEQIRLAGEECLRNGITSVHDAGSSFRLAEAMRGLAEAGELPVRIAMMIRAGSAELRGRLSADSRIETENDLLSVRSVKVSIDGALGPHGAWLLEPYEDLTTTSGLNTVSIDELLWIAELCKQHEWQLCVHAIGDRANREVLDAYELTLGSAAGSDHRWRIEHAQHLSPEDIPRFGQLGVIPAMQANHCTSDAIFVPARLGERRSQQGAYVWRSLIDSGAIIPNGTDAPVEKIDPRVSLFASVTRRLSNGEAFYPTQCMTREESLLSYTLWPAIAAFQEDDLGSIEIGKRADFAIWDRDLLKCPPDEILEARVLRTILGGKVVFATR